MSQTIKRQKNEYDIIYRSYLTAYLTYMEVSNRTLHISVTYIQLPYGIGHVWPRNYRASFGTWSRKEQSRREELGGAKVCVEVGTNHMQLGRKKIPGDAMFPFYTVLVPVCVPLYFLFFYLYVIS